MSYAEFPSTVLHREDGDHHELIEFYLEVRDKYTATLNEITKVSNELDEYRRNMSAEISSAVNKEVTKQVATAINALQKELDTVKKEVSANRSLLDSIADNLQAKDDYLEGEIEALATKLDATKSQLSAEIATVRSELTKDIDNNLKEMLDKLDEFKSITDSAIAEVRQEALGYTYRLVQRTEASLLDTINNLQQSTDAAAMKWLWQYGCCHGGFTAMQWYSLSNITAEDWQRVSPTAWEWYTNGRELFRKFDRRNKVFSPVSGKFVPVKIALLELAAALNIGSLTAEEYDSLGLTADEYEHFMLTAKDYDWNGKEKLYVSEGDRSSEVTAVATE